MGTGRRRRAGLAWAIALACLIVPAGAIAEFGDGVPGENPRINTPNDRSFDRCEGDDPNDPPDDTDEPGCSSYFEEDFRLFGFSPDSANMTPPGAGLEHSVTGTRYEDCSQLDEQGQQANIAAEGATTALEQEAARCLQIAGIRADSAWKYSTGDPETVVAILDTGIRWQEREPRRPRPDQLRPW